MKSLRWSIPNCSCFRPFEATLNDTFAVHLGLVASLIPVCHAEDQPAIDQLVKVLATSESIASSPDLIARSLYRLFLSFAETRVCL